MCSDPEVSRVYEVVYFGLEVLEIHNFGFSGRSFINETRRRLPKLCSELQQRKPKDNDMREKHMKHILLVGKLFYDTVPTAEIRCTVLSVYHKIKRCEYFGRFGGVLTFFYNFEDVDNFYHFAVAVY